MEFIRRIISGILNTPGSVKPREVSSTKVSIRQECVKEADGDVNSMRSGISLPRVFIRRTTKHNQTAGAAPVPTSGANGVPL